MISAKELRKLPDNNEKLTREDVDRQLENIEAAVMEAHDEGETSATVRVYSYFPGEPYGKAGDRVLAKLRELGYEVTVEPCSGYWGGTALVEISWGDTPAEPRKSVDDWVQELSDTVCRSALPRYTFDTSVLSEYQWREVSLGLSRKGYAISTTGMPDGFVEIVDMDREN